MLFIPHREKTRLERCQGFSRRLVVRLPTAVACTLPVMVLAASGDTYLAGALSIKGKTAAVFAIIAANLLYLPGIYVDSPLFLPAKLITLSELMGGGRIGKGVMYVVLLFFSLSTTLCVGALVHESYHKTSVSATEAEAAILLLCLLAGFPQVVNSMIRFIIRVLQWQSSTEPSSIRRRLTVVNILDVVTFILHSIVGYYVGIDMFAPKLYVGLNFLTTHFFKKELKGCDTETCDFSGSIFTTLCIFALACSFIFSLSAIRPFATIKDFFKYHPHGNEDRPFTFRSQYFLINMGIFTIVGLATLAAVCGLVGHFETIEDANPSPNALESSKIVAFAYFSLIYGLRPLSGLVEYTHENYSRGCEAEPVRSRRFGCCDFFSSLPSRIWNYCSGQSDESSQPLLIN